MSYNACYKVYNKKIKKKSIKNGILSYEILNIYEMKVLCVHVQAPNGMRVVCTFFLPFLKIINGY